MFKWEIFNFSINWIIYTPLYYFINIYKIWSSTFYGEIKNDTGVAWDNKFKWAYWK